MIKTTNWALKTESYVTWRILLYSCKRNKGLLLLYVNRLTVTKLKNIIYVSGNEKQIRFHSNKSVPIQALHKSPKISSFYACSLMQNFQFMFLWLESVDKHVTCSNFKYHFNLNKKNIKISSDDIFVLGSNICVRGERFYTGHKFNVKSYPS